ncbi:unannotated protein [freshwater metagenome]
MHRGRIMRFGSDVERDDQTGLLQRRPQRFPDVVVPLRRAEAGSHREIRRFEPHASRTVHLGDPVLGVEQWDGGGTYVALRIALVLDRPIVDRCATSGEQLRVLDRRHPDTDRRKDEFGPDSLTVEVEQTLDHVVRTRCSFVDREPLIVLECGRATRHTATDFLPVDVQRLMRAIVILDAARHTVREFGREAGGEQVVRLDEV